MRILIGEDGRGMVISGTLTVPKSMLAESFNAIIISANRNEVTEAF